eukprot:sb/3475758/
MSNGTRAFLTLPKSLKRNSNLRSSDSEVLHQSLGASKYSLCSRLDQGSQHSNTSNSQFPGAVCVPSASRIQLCDRYGDTVGVARVHNGIFVHSCPDSSALRPGDKILYVNEFSTARMSLPSAR